MVWVVGGAVDTTSLVDGFGFYAGKTHSRICAHVQFVLYIYKMKQARNALKRFETKSG